MNLSDQIRFYSALLINVTTLSVSHFLETGIFGVPLENLLDRDQLRLPNANLVCPVFVDEICTFLENHGLTLEGILRVPGNSHRIKVCVYVRWQLEYIILYVVLYMYRIIPAILFCSMYVCRL